MNKTLSALLLGGMLSAVALPTFAANDPATDGNGPTMPAPTDQQPPTTPGGEDSDGYGLPPAGGGPGTDGNPGGSNGDGSTGGDGNGAGSGSGSGS